MSHGSPVDLELQVRGYGVIREQGGSGCKIRGGQAVLHIPATGLVHGCVELEGLFKVVETDHLLIECVHLNAAPVVGEVKGLGGLWVQYQS